MTAIGFSKSPPGTRLIDTGLALLVALVLLGSAQPLQAAGDQGFLYGKITTDRGSTYEGRLRWGNQEAFWGDFFNGTKRDRQLPDDVPDRVRHKDGIKIFGITLRMGSGHDMSRVFKVHFGDIKQIRVRGNDSAVLTMKDDSTYRVGGGSDDLGGTIQVWDTSLGEVEVDWDRIDTIDFLPAPRDLDTSDDRLFGTVETRVGEFRGYIQWDQDECVTSDKLDGDTEEANLSIAMGKIRSIERHSRSSSAVTLEDGRELILDDSNDVDSDNRGIFVDDSRYGRVLISWDAFRRIEFSDPKDSGPSYADFKAGKPLRGKVTDESGKTYSGRIVFDLDESQTWEFFDGNARDIEYIIPMGMLASISPRSHDSSRVVLANGEKLELEDTADTGHGNDGILIIEDGGNEIYVEWDEVRIVEFDR